MSSETAAGAAPRLKRALSLWDLVFCGIILIQPTAPMPLFGVVHQEARGHVVTTILIGMVAMLFTAISYGRMARAYPLAGSAYTYVGREIHPALGYVTGWSMAMDYMINPILCVVWCSKAAGNIAPDIPRHRAHQRGARRGHGSGGGAGVHRRRAVCPRPWRAGAGLLHQAVL